jgi:hypothetical protein
MKASQAFESVISDLDRAENVQFRIHLEVQVESEDVVSDNADTLGFSQKRFD